MMDLNARTVFNCCRAVVPRLLAAGGGRIVNVAARAATRGQGRMGPYCAAKAAVITLTESLADELKDAGIRVNCVLPGTLDTPQNRAAMPDADPGRWVTTGGPGRRDPVPRLRRRARRHRGRRAGLRARMSGPRASGDHARRPAGRCARPAVARLILLLAGLLAVAVVCAAAATLTPETQQVLVNAVEAAAALDFYNARCRSDDSGRHSDNLNKQLVGKLHITIIGVQDDLFPEHSFRAVQRRFQEQFTEDLRAAGGCQGAKAAGVSEQLNERYREGVTAIEALP